MMSGWIAADSLLDQDIQSGGIEETRSRRLLAAVRLRSG